MSTHHVVLHRVFLTLLVLLLNPFCSLSYNCDDDGVLQAEEGTSSIPLELCNNADQLTPCIQCRSRASKSQTVWLDRPRQSISYKISAPSSCELDVTDVQYSNDGGKDIIRVLLNDDFIGEFTTDQGNRTGHGWNIIKHSGEIGGIPLPTGIHHLTIIINSTDDEGVELDEMHYSFNVCTGDCPIVFKLDPAADCSTKCGGDVDSLSDAVRLGIGFGIVIALLLVVPIILAVCVFYKRVHAAYII